MSGVIGRRVVAHRVNSDSICFVGFEPEIRQMCVEAKSWGRGGE